MSRDFISLVCLFYFNYLRLDSVIYWIERNTNSHDTETIRKLEKCRSLIKQCKRINIPPGYFRVVKLLRDLKVVRDSTKFVEGK